jgi:serine/threonine-protein kinase RsbT
VTFVPAGADQIDEIAIAGDRDVAVARLSVSKAMEAAGAKATLKTRFVTAVSEIARNALVHAGGGRLRVFTDGAVVYVVCDDQGPGIPDVEAAMQDGFTTAKSLGRGLGGAKRLVASFEIESGPSGTVVRMASR